MDFSDYFDPVSLERPDLEYLERQHCFSHHISVHTPDQPIRDLDQHRVVLIGVPEDRKGYVEGSAGAPDQVRKQLYRLARINRGLKIYDLGNLKTGRTVKDSYFALRDCLLELQERKIIALILGGSQDLCQGAFMALQKRKGLKHVLSVDSMFDFNGGDSEPLHSRVYLDTLFQEGMKDHFSYANLGQQAYFVNQDQLDRLEESHFESIRLGQAKADIRQTEPLIRDSVLLSIDMSAVRQCDAPGAAMPSPNGFNAEELCQITRYAGMSNHTEIIGFFEYLPAQDTQGQTALLVAQASWYFLEGLSQRNVEVPSANASGFTSFVVNMDAAGHDINFLKSSTTGRWWMEIPVKNPDTGHNFFISCSYEDYQHASRDEIPDRWWRYLNILGKEED